jgi:hypothetical protein
MADPYDDDVVEVRVQTPAPRSAKIVGSPGDLAILKVLAARAATTALRKLRKDERLQREAVATDRR